MKKRECVRQRTGQMNELELMLASTQRGMHQGGTSPTAHQGGTSVVPLISFDIVSIIKPSLEVLQFLLRKDWNRGTTSH